ncbi:MAG: hypothetical protein WCL02_08110 [bacterium]
MSFTKDINPMIFRQISQEGQKISASERECSLLADMYNKTDLMYKKNLTAVIQKV